MKTVKHILAVLLCFAMVVSTLALTGAALDDDDPKIVNIKVPVVSVTKSLGLIAFELALDFYSDEAQAADGDTPVFTDFDPDAVIEGEVFRASKSLATFTAKPTAYNAQDGVLTVEVFDEKGVEGVKMFALKDVPYETDNEVIQSTQRSVDKLLGRLIAYSFKLPQGLLKGDKAESVKRSFQVNGSIMPGVPAREVKVVGHSFYYRVADHIMTQIEDGSTGKLNSAGKRLLARLWKFFVKANEGIEEMEDGKISAKTVFYSFPTVMVAFPFALTIFLNFIRAGQIGVREYR